MAKRDAVASFRNGTAPIIVEIGRSNNIPFGDVLCIARVLAFSIFLRMKNMFYLNSFLC